MSLKVVVIGAGFAKAAYLPALATIPDVEVVALASARMDSAQSTGDAFHIPHAYDDWRVMLEKHPADFFTELTDAPPFDAAHLGVEVALKVVLHWDDFDEVAPP